MIDIDRTKIEALIPHAGNMCLLDRVTHWDAGSIHCVATSHRDCRNPLSVDGVLGAICGVEYAAQAMAVHGGLTGAAGPRPRGGYLASLRALVLHRERLDDLDGELVIEAERLAGEGAHVTYRFVVSCAGKIALGGRAAVLLDSGEA